MIDTHCHLHDREIYAEMLARQPKAKPADFTPERMLENAERAGVSKIITIGTNHADSLVAGEFARGVEGSRNSGSGGLESGNSKLGGVEVFWSYGVHPEFADVKTDLLLKEKSEKLVAIGEVGLDYHYAGYDRAMQIALLEKMIDLALKLDLPLIFHVREAFDDFFGVVRNFSGTGRLTGVMHSFSDKMENLVECLNLGFFIGVNGLATFADIPLPPLERTLLETDAPYLAPRPYRGQINQPAHVRAVAEWLSERNNVALTEVDEITTRNAEGLFSI